MINITQPRPKKKAPVRQSHDI